MRASESLGNVFGDAYLILVPSCPASVIPDGHLAAQPSPLAHGSEGQTCPFPHLLASQLGCAAACTSLLIPFSHLYRGKVGKTLGSLPHRGVVRAN